LEDNVSDQSTTVTEPCFGQIHISRVSSNKAHPLYGSKLKHGNFITLSISQSELKRSLNTDWHHPLDEIIEVSMSENQFASLISSLNIGTGTPCTISRLHGKLVPPPTYINERKTVDREVAEKATQVVSELKVTQQRVADLLKPGAKITKGELTEIHELLRKQVQEVALNIPYMLKCFEENMDAIVTSAKADVEAHVMAVMLKQKAVDAPPEPCVLELES
jgi:hypothetical protein